MKKICLISIASMLASTMLAHAEDSPFSGFYAGVSGGTLSGEYSHEFDYDSLDQSFLGTGLILLDGMYADSFSAGNFGGQVGYNYVTQGGFLLGAEYSLSTGSTSVTRLYTESGRFDAQNLGMWGSSGEISFTDTISDLSAIEAKVGMVSGKWAFYAKGGITMANFTHATVGEGCYGDLYGTCTFEKSFTDTLSGVSFGAGVEMMLTDNISIGASYSAVTFDESAREGETLTSYVDDGTFNENDFVTNNYVNMKTESLKVMVSYYF